MSPSGIFDALRQYGFGAQRVIPSLDGLRAISIVLVLIAHLRGTRNFPIPAVYTPALGEFGVRVLFVISGFLITSILLEELRRTGRISLARFYFRRTLRLFPATYFLIAVVAVLALRGVVHLAAWDMVCGLTYSMNFHESRAWTLGHLWSLAVEEQFYLLWPVTLRKLGAANAGQFLTGILIIAPLLRMISPWVGSAFNFLVWSDALATGCLLAVLRQNLADNHIYSRLLASRWMATVPIIALTANYIPSTKLLWLFGNTIMNVAIAIAADWAMRHPAGAIGRFLNLPLVTFIGVLSYSLYLWQQLFLNRYSISPYCAFPLNLMLAVLAALISYLLIESPFLRMRVVIEQKLRRRHIVCVATQTYGHCRKIE
jgi:peptidoglycan/LPS O-acetylase OafA/YrhL